MDEEDEEEDEAAAAAAAAAARGELLPEPASGEMGFVGAATGGDEDLLAVGDDGDCVFFPKVRDVTPVVKPA